jgi:hypothetical protein
MVQNKKCSPKSCFGPHVVLLNLELDLEPIQGRTDFCSGSGVLQQPLIRVFAIWTKRRVPRLG